MVIDHGLVVGQDIQQPNNHYTPGIPCGIEDHFMLDR